MNPDEFRQLVEDIRINGQIEPVLLHPVCKRIVDGRHRAIAVRELGLEIKSRVFDGNPEDMFQLVLSLNLKRRHLTASQKAVLGLRVEEYEAQKASLRRRATQNNFSGGVIADELTADKIKLPCLVGQARDIAAKLVGVSPRYITEAKKLKETSPDLLEQVSRGEITLSKAILENKRVERKSLVSTLRRDKPQTYNVILADPPWDYFTQSCDAKHIGVPEDYYDSMSDIEISGILRKIKIDIDENSVCLLWATNPMLVRALRILDEWGFSYKTNLCWVKDRGYPAGMGYYFRSRHEILLLGVRGSFLPLTRKVVPSFLMTKPREHSRKPDEIYDIIESLYPDCNYLEIFARNRHDGWDCYGNDIEKFDL